MNGILKLSWTNIKSSLVYGILWGLLAVFIKISETGNIFALDWKDLLNAGVMSFLAIVIVLLKNLFTTDEGKFLGIIKVVPPLK